MSPPTPTPEPERDTTMTIEAFADTIVPGQKRFPEDRAIAGAATGGGAVVSGALELLRWSATGVHEWLDDLAVRLNEHAGQYAAECGLTLDPSVPAFVALSFTERSALVARLTTPGHPEKPFWVSLALFSNMAYDSAAHMNTTQAIAEGHPGLTAMGIEPPGDDGLWRFPAYSYRRKLADPHPDTTPSGSPA